MIGRKKEWKKWKRKKWERRKWNMRKWKRKDEEGRANGFWLWQVIDEWSD